MSISPGLATVIIVLAAFWVAIAAFMMILASRRISRANALLGGARSVASLLRSVPARPLIVRPDGGIESDTLLQRDLGLAAMPANLDDLATEGLGLDPADLAGLKADVQTAAISGTGIARQVRIAGTERAVEVRGGLAPPPYAAGTLLLWLFDATGAEAERLKLATQLGRTEAALDALTHLIESAPFPMWYRGPDMSLGLVNSAFVAAVEGRDAAEVIALAAN